MGDDTKDQIADGTEDTTDDKTGADTDDQIADGTENTTDDKTGADIDDKTGADTDDQIADEPEDGKTGAVVVPLFSVPDSLRSVDVLVGGRAVRGLLLVAVVLLLTLGGRWWWVQQQAAGVPIEQVSAGHAVDEQAGDGQAGDGQADGEGAVGEGNHPGRTLGGTEASEEVALSGEGDGSSNLSAAGSSGVGSQAGASGGEGPATELSLVVHVIGKVHDPGVVELPPGSRVVDAVRAAGGVTDEADPSSLNLARPVVDGEQVWVGAPGEEPPPGLWSGPAQPITGGGAGAGSPGTDHPGAGGGQSHLLVDLNLANPTQLQELPGVGPVTASNIIAWREQHGRFSVVEELMEVSGIGEKTFEHLRAHVTVGG